VIGCVDRGDLFARRGGGGDQGAHGGLLVLGCVVASGAKCAKDGITGFTEEQLLAKRRKRMVVEMVSLNSLLSRNH